MAKKNEITITTTAEEMSSEIIMSYEAAAREKGIDEAMLARKAKAELNAKTVKLHKVPGVMKAESPDLPPGYKVVGVFVDSEGVETTLIEQSAVDFATRQKGRESQHRLYDHYPAERRINENRSITFISMMPEPDPPPDEDDPTARISGTEHLLE
jgi:hypothetical protein